MAGSDGVVESVSVKQGEEVDAYTNLISILPKSPTSAVGYLHAEKNNPAIGTKVQLLGYDARWKTAEGKVIGYGAITELPEILQKSTVEAWKTYRKFEMAFIQSTTAGVT